METCKRIEIGKILYNKQWMRLQRITLSVLKGEDILHKHKIMEAEYENLNKISDGDKSETH